MEGYVPEVSIHVWLRAAVVFGVLDGSLLARHNHVGRVTRHVVQTQLVRTEPTGEIDVPETIKILLSGSTLDYYIMVFNSM